jgi:hypothetical protein
MALNQICGHSYLNRHVFVLKARNFLISAAYRKNVCFTAAVTTVERDVESYLTGASSRPHSDVTQIERIVSNWPHGDTPVQKHESMWENAEQHIEKLKNLTNELEYSMKLLQQVIGTTIGLTTSALIWSSIS